MIGASRVHPVSLIDIETYQCCQTEIPAIVGFQKVALGATVLPMPFTCTSSGPAWLLHFLNKVQRCEFRRITLCRERKGQSTSEIRRPAWEIGSRLEIVYLASTENVSGDTERWSFQGSPRSGR